MLCHSSGNKAALFTVHSIHERCSCTDPEPAMTAGQAAGLVTVLSHEGHRLNILLMPVRRTLQIDNPTTVQPEQVQPADGVVVDVFLVPVRHFLQVGKI